jgi:mycothiol synthase
MLHVSPAAVHEWLPALRRLFADRPHPAHEAEHLFTQYLAGELGTVDLIVARDAGTIRGVVLAQWTGGRQGSVGVPSADDDSIAAAIMQGVLARAAELNVVLLQAIVLRAELAQAQCLQRCGFEHITQIVFLMRPCRPNDALALPECVRRVEPHDPQFAALLDATYDRTLDVPELNGVRTIADVIESYLSVWRGEAPTWWAWHEPSEPDPVGLVMLGPLLDGVIELTYLGLRPSARGRGLGARLLRVATSQAVMASANALILNVDVRNEPALRLYRERLFREFDRREVLLLRLKQIQ